MIESWGRGIARIMVLCEKNSISAPKLSDESSGLGIEFGLDSHVAYPTRGTSQGASHGASRGVSNR